MQIVVADYDDCVIAGIVSPVEVDLLSVPESAIYCEFYDIKSGKGLHTPALHIGFHSPEDTVSAPP